MPNGSCLFSASDPAVLYSAPETRKLHPRLQAFGDDAAAIKDFGADVVAALCERLRAGGAPSLHFYTLNQSVATLEVCRRLGRCD